MKKANEPQGFKGWNDIGIMACTHFPIVLLRAMKEFLLCKGNNVITPLHPLIGISIWIKQHLHHSLAFPVRNHFV
jgi:hypothetical protein